MNSQRKIETLLGLVVLMAALGFAVRWAPFAAQSVSSQDEISVLVRFNSAAGLSAGSPVRIGGVRVGQVDSLEVDTETYQAVARLVVDAQLALPIDTEAAIASGGLLSPNFVRLVPGASAQTLPAGGEITRTKSALSLEELLGRVIFLATGAN